jgi:hypothetical protein
MPNQETQTPPANCWRKIAITLTTGATSPLLSTRFPTAPAFEGLFVRGQRQAPWATISGKTHIPRGPRALFPTWQWTPRACTSNPGHRACIQAPP